ncbi:MAG: hydroxyisourate hydrolase [Halieaceae bacterium]|jgi:5-hydroxyisourate hydrolase|nr:hydroxyisourate hydrolase [Halieaceae bacterium]
MSQITTHVLDTALGTPAQGIDLTLYRHDSALGSWRELASGTTNGDGRVADLLEAGTELPAGTYRLRFVTGPYLEKCAGGGFYPWVDVVFAVARGGEHYHVPLLLSPHGYSTYRGS